MFYEGQLQNGVSANERRADWLAAPDPIPGAEPVENEGRALPLAEPGRADDVL